MKVQVKDVLLRFMTRTVDDLGVLQAQLRVVEIDNVLHRGHDFQQFGGGNVKDVLVMPLGNNECVIFVDRMDV